MTKTTNYQLNQWEADDVVTRADFNADNAAIDAALKTVANAAATAQSTANSANTTANAACKIAWGTYTGSGKFGADNPTTLTFPFQPKLVIVQTSQSAGIVVTEDRYKQLNMILMIRPLGQLVDATGTHDITITWSGNSVSWYSGESYQWERNMSVVYNYIALG